MFIRNLELESFCLKKGLDTSAKSIASSQPAQSAQTDLSRYILLSINFLQPKGSLYPIIPQVVFKVDFYGSIIM